MTTALPKPNRAEILKALAYLFDKGDVVELRALSEQGGRKRTDAGYFDFAHWSVLADAAVRLNTQGAAVYVTLNPVNPQLLSRYHNRIQQGAGHTTNDSQITRRRWLPIDVDPQRPAGTSATQEQLNQAALKATEIRKFLLAQGWPASAVAASGNGMHLLYAIDLPNDDASKKLIEGVLKALAARFDDESVKVDRSVFNAARIWKLYGTVANKGDHTEAAPWRLSVLSDQYMPARVLVTPEQMQALLQAPVAEPAHTPRGLDFGRSRTGQPFVVEEFMQRHGLEHTKDMLDGSERFKLAECPFNPEHKNGEAAIFRKPGGALAFKCFHNSCADKDWRAVREKYEGPRVERSTFPRIVNPDTGEIEADTDWQEPQPLPAGLPAVAAFDPDLLPESLRAWVDDISNRMQCPPDFVAVGAVAAISSLIGARAVVAPKARDDWRVVPNLWGLIVGRPGVMKSPALGEVLKPMDRLEGVEREQWLAAHGAWQVDSKLATMTAEANEKQARSLASKDPAKARALLEPVEMPPEPKARRYMVNDATVEKLADLLTINEWGLLVYRDEIHGLLCSMDRPGQEGSRGFYLTAYDGNRSHAVDRIGRGESFVPRVCLAMMGGTQPGKLHSYVREAVAGGAGDDGLLQRFGLTVWPDVSREFVYVDRLPDTRAKDAAWAVFDRLSKLQPAGDTAPHEWRFTPEAQAVFEEWLVPFETEIRGDDLHPALVSHLSKYRKLVPALALIFALVDTPDSGYMIDEPELLRALDWADYLRSHAERVYTAAVTPETTGADELLNKIKVGSLSDGDGVLLDSFTPRLVAAKHWTGLGTPDAVRKAAELLADYGWLKREVIPTGAQGGRPSERYLIHPVLLKGGV